MRHLHLDLHNSADLKGLPHFFGMIAQEFLQHPCAGDNEEHTCVYAKRCCDLKMLESLLIMRCLIALLATVCEAMCYN